MEPKPEIILISVDEVRLSYLSISMIVGLHPLIQSTKTFLGFSKRVA